MARMNENFRRLQGSYLFAEVGRKVKEYKESNPEAKVIRLGIGDVTEPLTPSVIKGLSAGVEEMSRRESFQGYPPYEGFEFLRKAIALNDFQSKGIAISSDEIFVSTGAKEDTANIQEIFSLNSKLAITDPVYPVYVDSNVMAGRSGEFSEGKFQNLVYLPCHAENNFIPELPKEKVDLIYLCFPNNPTGQSLTKDQLKTWVDYALKNDAVILFDAAYEAFIRQDNVPHSIYEIEGAKEVAIEFRSLSKTAGFTGTRCAYTIIPKELKLKDIDGNSYSVRELWLRRQSTKFNGVAYVIQKGAEAVFSPEGQKECRNLVNFYLENAKIISEGIKSLGFTYSGGVNSPYIWFKVPTAYNSWAFFDKLLHDCQVVGTPGVGFGQCGEGYFRLSSFGKREDVIEAISRLKNLKF